MSEAPPTVQPRVMSNTERDSSGRFSRLGVEKPPKVLKLDLTPERTPRAIDRTSAGGRRELNIIALIPSEEQIKAVGGGLQAEWKQTYPDRDEAAFGFDPREAAANYFDRVLTLQWESYATDSEIKANREAVRRVPVGSPEEKVLNLERTMLMQHRRDTLADLNAEVGFAREVGLKVEPEQDERGTTFGEKVGRVVAEAGWQAAAGVAKAGEVEQRAQRFAGRQVERATEAGGRLLEGAGNAVGERVQGGMSWLQRAGERWDAIIDAIPGKAKGASELGRSAIDKFGRPAWNAAAAWAERNGVGEKVGKATGAVGGFLEGMKEKGTKLAEAFSEPDKKIVAALNRVGGWVDGAKDAVGARVSSEWQRLAGPSRETARAVRARLERSKESYRQSESGIMRAIGLRLEEAGEYCEPFVDRIKDEGRIWRDRGVGIADGVGQGVRGAVRKVGGGVENLTGRVGREAQLRWEGFMETGAGQLLQEGAEHMRLWGNNARKGLNGLMDRVGAGGGRFKKLVENAAARLTRKSETDSRTPDERKSVAEYFKEKTGEIGKALGALREYVSARMVRKAEEAGMDQREANAFMRFAGAAGTTSARVAERAFGGTVVNGERMVRFVASHKKGTAIALAAAAAVAIMVHPDVGQWVQQVAQGLNEAGNAIGNAGANAADAIGGVSRAVQEGVSELGATGFVGTPDAQEIVSDVVQAPDLGTVVGAVAETARTSAQEIAAGLPVGQENGIWNQVQDAIKGIQDPAQRVAQELGIMVDYGKLHSDNAIKTAQAIVDNASNYRPGEVALAQAQLNAQKALQGGGQVNLETAQAAIRYLNPALG